MNGDKEQEQPMETAVVSAGANGSQPSLGDTPGQLPSPAAALRADASIRDAIERGDGRHALTLCTRLHAAAIGRLCMAITGSQAEADDLTQETLLSAYDGFSGFRGEGSIRSWLLGIARRRCARHIERRSRREAKLRLVHDAAQQPETDELIAARRQAQAARAALERVRPTEREALLLRYVSELSYREVGAACGIEEAAARKRVSRAIATLRDVLGSKEQER
jgi:RNA polymerase sigma-70 factor (ECF subfamily)